MSLNTLVAPEVSQETLVYSPESEDIETLDRVSLDKILDCVVSCMQKFGKDEIFDPATTKVYHEFSQTQAKRSFLIPFLNEYGIDTDSLYLVLGEVGATFDGSVHAHEFSDAICYVLGEDEGFVNAEGAYAVRCESDWVAVEESESNALVGAPEESWFPIFSGDKIYNFRTVAHSFKAKGAQGYSFICVQTPGIDNPKFDDWIPAKINGTRPETEGLVRGIRHQSMLAAV